MRYREREKRVHTGEMDCGQKEKKEGYVLNSFHRSVSNKYHGDKKVQCGY